MAFQKASTRAMAKNQALRDSQCPSTPGAHTLVMEEDKNNLHIYIYAYMYMCVCTYVHVYVYMCIYPYLKTPFTCVREIFK